jgi:non-specific serine/threonine protein kinase
LLLMLGNFRCAYTRGQAALEQQRTRGDELGVALALTVLGNAALQRGNLEEARALHLQAAERLRRTSSPTLIVNLGQLGLVAGELGDTQLAHQTLGELEEIVQTRRDNYARLCVLYHKGLLAATGGDRASAIDFLEQALALVRSAGNQQATVTTLTELGRVRLDQGQRPAALADFAEAIRLAEASGERIRMIRALEGCARALATNESINAVYLAGAMDEQRPALDALPWPSERRNLDDWLGQVRRTLGPSTYREAWEDGRASTLEQAVRRAEALTVDAVANSSPGGVLSPRERQVALLLARGLTNKQIATELTVAANTVRAHVEHILDKLDLHSRAQIAVWAIQQGLLSSPS